jgi:heme-degrading monooxygenase HmoA
MLLERSELTIRAGQEDAFAAAMQARGLPLLRKVPGVLSLQIGRGVENPDKFLLLVEWESMAAHNAFSASPALHELIAIMTPHTTGGGMEHFQMH